MALSPITAWKIDGERDTLQNAKKKKSTKVVY